MLSEIRAPLVKVGARICLDERTNAHRAMRGSLIAGAYLFRIDRDSDQMWLFQFDNDYELFDVQNSSCFSGISVAIEFTLCLGIYKRRIPLSTDSGTIQGAPKLILFPREFKLVGFVSRFRNGDARNEFSINEIIITLNIFLGFRSKFTLRSIFKPKNIIACI